MKSLRHKPSRKPSSLVYSVFPNNKSLSFFLISVKMDLENKVIGFQFEPERSISNHKGFFPGKISTLAFGASVGTAPQWKRKSNASAVKKWTRFAILFFRVYLSWVKQKFYRNYRSSRTEVFEDHPFLWNTFGGNF